MEEQPKLKSVQSAERQANYARFTLTSRRFRCLLWQEDGRVKERVELIFSVSDVYSVNLRAKLHWSWFRIIPFDQTFDKHPSGDVIQGIVTNSTGEREVFVAVSDRVFSYLTQQPTSVVCSATVWPFQALENWDGSSSLLIRTVEFNYR